MFTLSLLKRLSILALALLSSAGFAETSYDFKGAISFSNSTQNLVGQELEYSFKLLSETPVSGWEVFPGYWQNNFQASSVLLTVNGTPYALDDYLISAIGYTSQFGDTYGFVAAQRYTGLANPAQLQVGLWSSSSMDTDSNYLPLEGLPLSNFTGLIRVMDDTWGVDGSIYQGFAEARITSYSITSSNVPDNSSTLLLLGFPLFGFAFIRRKTILR